MERTPISINDMVGLILKVCGVNPTTRELKTNHKIEIEMEDGKVKLISVYNKGTQNKTLIQYHNADGALIHYNWVVKKGWVRVGNLTFASISRHCCADASEA